jgi:hypothetical protein
MNKKLGHGNSLADQDPDVAKFWYQSGNGSLTPYDVVYGSGKKVCWCCENGPFHKTAVVFAQAQTDGENIQHLIKVHSIIDTVIVVYRLYGGRQKPRKLESLEKTKLRVF